MVYGFPPRILTKLRYFDTYAIISTAGSIAKQIMTLNSTFDPDYSGVGHQPLYRDTYASIYDHYSVVSCVAKATFISGLTTGPVLVGAVIDDDTTTSTTLTTLCEQSKGQHKLLPGSTGAPTKADLVSTWSCQRDLSIDPYSSETYKTAVGTTPTEFSNLLLWAAPADGSSTTTTYVCVEMVQSVLWTELSTPTQS